MLKRRVLLSALVVLALFGTTFAQARSDHHFKVTAQLAVISQSPRYPARGTTIVLAGTENGRLFGNGSLLQRDTVTGRRSATTSFKGHGTDVYSHGTIESTLSGKATLNPDGSVKVTGMGHYIGGTGSFRHASGKFSFTGSFGAPAGCTSQKLTVHEVGTITY